MPRGRQLRTKVREEQALTIAKLKAEAKFNKTPDGIIGFVKEKLGAALENTSPLELGAVAALTYLIGNELIAIKHSQDKAVTPPKTPVNITPFGAGGGFGGTQYIEGGGKGGAGGR